jgi:protein-disulfide isomerase
MTTPPMSRPQGRLRPPVQPSDHVQGGADAAVTLVEYGDFQCPYCFRAHPVVQELQRRLGESLRFVFRNFPIAELHEHAELAAEAAESVASHAGAEAYWRMHDAIFTHQQDSRDALDRTHLLRYAAESGADPALVDGDLERRAFEARVHADFLSGVRSGVNGTPTFFIDGERFDGDWTDVERFAEALGRAGASVAAP